MTSIDHIHRDRADCWRAFLEGKIDLDACHRIVGVSDDS